MQSDSVSRLTGDIVATCRDGAAVTVALAGSIRLRLERDLVGIWWRDGLALASREPATPQLYVWRNAVAVPAAQAGPGETVRSGGVELARDLDGDGYPDVLLSTRTGRWQVYSLAARPRLLGEVKGCGEWRHPAGEAAPVFTTTALGTTVVLRYREGRFALYPNRMRRPHPSDETIAALVPRMRGERLRRQMVEWVFAGNAREAARLFVASWTDGAAAGEVFLDAVRESLRGSGHWDALLEMNGPVGLLR
jgi:hypothetical protein